MSIPARDTTRGMPVRPAAVLFGAVLCASSLGLTSCLWKSSGESAGFEETDSISPGLYVTAEIIAERKIIEKRFKSFLPDSGIVPLEVNIRNRTERPVVIHTSHGLDAPEPFHGFALEAGGREYAPLAPLDALAVLMGEGETILYRKPGVMDAVVGIALPPAIILYGHREMKIGRRYRSLFKHSIYEATDGGAIMPIIMDPGDEISGFLFFHMPGDGNPFLTGEDGATIIDTARVAELKLVSRPNSVMTIDTLAGVSKWSDAVVAYISSPSVSGAGAELADPSGGERSGHGTREGMIFAIPAGGKWRSGDLLAGRIVDVLERGESAMSGLSEGISSKAVLIGAAALGDHAVCAVNFKASSRVYLLDISGRPSSLEEIELDRKIRRVFLSEEAALVATDDDRCRYISLDGMKQRRNIKTGKRVRDVFLDGDDLVVLGEEELSVYSVAPDDPLRLVDRRSIPKANRRIAGTDGGIVYMIHGSGNAGRDTLAAYERESFEETGRMVLPASAGFAEVGTGDLMLQLDGDALLRIVYDRESRGFEAEVIGHLPFDIAFIERVNNGYTVIGTDGSMVTGNIVPSLMREYIIDTKVGIKMPEVTSSRSRVRR